MRKKRKKGSSLKMSGNDEKESGNPLPGTSERVDKPPESDPASRKYSELYESEEVVKRQMEMISESLAACKRMSKRRSPKKEVDEAAKPEVLPLGSSTGNLPDESKQYHGHPDAADNHSPVLSHLLKEKMERREETCPEEKQESFSNDSSDPETFSSLPEDSSQIGMYRSEEVDPTKMMEVIQRELTSLLKMAPVVSPTVNELFDTVHHYQSCSKCKVKIRSSLPWILNTVQELVKHVTKKRRGTYVWQNEYSYLRLPSIHSLGKESLQGEEKKREVGKDGKPEIVLGNLVKVDAVTTSDCKPGLQIQLEVKPKKTKKKFFSRKIRIAESRHDSLGESCLTERPKESAYNFLFQVEKPSPPPEIAWTVKRSVLVSRGVASAVLFQPRFRCLGILSGLVLVPVIWVTFQPEGRISNGVERLVTGEGKMQVEKMRELEAEVKGLKDLMLEVHKNQMELSKVLIEKGVYSQTIIRLTDPKMLEEENEVVSKAAQIEISQQETSSSTETLQRIVDDLKRKCAVKNRMIVSLLRGLRTDIPNEWWEEIVDYVFTDSKPNGEFDPDRMNEFVRQTSAYLLNKKASKEPSPVTQEDEKPSEEEGQRKWEVKPEAEWNVLFEDLLPTTTATREVFTSSEANGLSPSLRPPVNFFTFPASLEFDSKPEVMIKNLENQILLLNAENDRLWTEINELRSLLKASVEESNEMEQVSNRSSRGLSEVIKTSGKTINLTIQIGDKESRRSSRAKVKKSSSVEEWCLERGKSKSSPIVKCVSSGGECDILPEVSPRPNLSEHERKIQPKLLTDARYPFRSNGNRNRSDVDLTSLDDISPALPHYVRKEGNERLRNFLRDKMESVQHVMVATPRPSQHDFDRDFKLLPTNVSEPGPSKETGSRRPNLTNLFLKPSIIQLVEKQSQCVTGPSPTITNERGLQTIPENDSTFSTTSDSGQSVDQALQVLRAKVKSIHKDVTVLKSKNDRMDKLLDRLLEEAVENSQNFEEMGSQVNGLRERHT